MLIIHIGFCKQHIHVPGHAARDRMDGVIDLCAVFLQCVSKVFDLMLGLGQGHAVARHDNDVFGVFENPCQTFVPVFRRRRAFGRNLGICLCHSGCCSGLFGGCCRFTKQDGHEPAVHGLAHYAGEHIACRADNAANSDQQRVGDREAGNGARNAAHGVEQGNRDWHVRAANAHGEDNAEKRAGNEHQPDHQQGQESRRNVIYYKRKQHDSQQNVHNGAVPGKHNGLLGKQAMQFARGHKGAGNCRHARTQGKAGVNAVKGRFRPHIDKHDQAEDGCRAAAKAMQKGHKLRHLDHLDLVGQEKTESHANGNGNPELQGAKRIVPQHGDDDGQGHGRRADDVARGSLPDIAHQVQPI